jgi:Zn-dependent peptidase ImmA (M78 family)
MAVQFENVTKIPANFWLNHQRSYDEYIARKKRMEVIRASVDWAKQFPLAEMVKKGWITATSSIEEKTAELLSFFGVSTPEAWHDYYFDQQLKVAFRISLSHTSEPFALSAWLRRGELQASELPVTAYSEKAFKELLSSIKKLMATHPEDFFQQLQSMCLSVGVKVVHTPCLPKAPINGSTRWLNETPFIQLTGRYNRNDAFWFTFFHEAGHIILHGKKDIFLENIEYPDKDFLKEKEANEFAVRWTFTKEQERAVISRKVVTENDIVQFAQEFNTHPAIIIGRLQHDRLIPYSLGRNFFVKVDLN